MYDIRILVKGDGTLLYTEPTIRLGTAKEKKRASLFFLLDDSVEGKFYYVKFKHDKATYTKRCDASVRLIVPAEVLTYPGKWEISFIATDQVITDDVISGNYGYVSEPHDAVVSRGIFGTSVYIYEQDFIKQWIESNRTVFDIPSYVTKIGDYFLYDYPKSVALILPESIIEIGDHGFYLTSITSISFPNGSNLQVLKDYAFFRIKTLTTFVVPKSVHTYSKYCFSNSSITSLSFEAGSKISSFPAFSFTNMAITELVLPKGCIGFNSASGQTISENSNLTRVWLPNSFTLNVAAGHFLRNPMLRNIELEEDWKASASFVNVDLEGTSIVNMFNALKNLQGQSAKTLTLGASNLAKVTNEQIEIATDKNWTVS